MHIENKELGVSFDLPEKYWVHLKQAFKTRMINCRKMYPGLDNNGVDTFIWHACSVLISNWECEHIKPDQFLGDIDSDLQNNIVEFVTSTVVMWINSLKEVPKN